MKTITQYEASDGTRFDRPEDAREHEAALRLCAVLAPLAGSADFRAVVNTPLLELTHFIVRNFEQIRAVAAPPCGRCSGSGKEYDSDLDLEPVRCGSCDGSGKRS